MLRVEVDDAPLAGATVGQFDERGRDASDDVRIGEQPVGGNDEGRARLQLAAGVRGSRHATDRLRRLRQSSTPRVDSGGRDRAGAAKSLGDARDSLVDNGSAKGGDRARHGVRRDSVDRAQDRRVRGSRRHDGDSEHRHRRPGQGNHEHRDDATCRKPGDAVEGSQRFHDTAAQCVADDFPEAEPRGDEHEQHSEYGDRTPDGVGNPAAHKRHEKHGGHCADDRADRGAQGENETGAGATHEAADDGDHEHNVEDDREGHGRLLPLGFCQVGDPRILLVFLGSCRHDGRG